MYDIIIKDATLINDGKQFNSHLAIKDGKIAYIGSAIPEMSAKSIINAKGKWLLPGIIDDQVHFREPGLTHKGDIWHESRAAAAGGVTSYMEMPNTQPQTINQTALSEKFEIAEKKSLVNYSFYMGATNDNLSEILKTDPKNVCGIKIFMGSSTGNMLVDNIKSLSEIFDQTTLPVAVHCEDEQSIQHQIKIYKEKYGENVPFACHPEIRNAEACYKSSSLAVELASKYGTRLHILHISTAKELSLFTAGSDVKLKKITSEVCIHHLWFNESDYLTLGSKIKWNPAIKSKSDQMALIEGLKNNKLDVIATDHSPHTFEEKSNTYFKAPSGGPLIQHSLVAMLELFEQGKIELTEVVKKMCHAPADLFAIKNRGYLKLGYWADLVLVEPNNSWKVSKNNILSKCNWSPFEDQVFRHKVQTTFVNGKIVYNDGKILETEAAMALEFNR